MRILVTGGSGFIGINFISKMLSKGHLVHNLDNLSLFRKDFNKKSQKYTFNKIDIRNKNSLNEIINEFKPDKVVHLAAETHVDKSISAPDNFVTTNVLGTYNLLQASLNFFKSPYVTKNFCFHHISTDEVYGSLKKNETSFNEDSKYKPNSPYSASKASSDHLVRAWQKTYNLPCVITSCTNNYGPYQHPEKFIPVVILSGIMKKSIPIYGKGNNIRDWIYVDDHVDALVTIIEKNIINKNYLIGSQNEKQNIEIVNLICDALDHLYDNNYSHDRLKTFVKDRLAHDYRYSVNSNLVQNDTTWRPKNSFSEGIQKTIRWYLQNEDWWRGLVKL